MPEKKITLLITAGPTRERIDPVRYLSNDSSGKMGYALAKAAMDLNHRVILVSGPTHLEPPQGVQFISVESAKQMKAQVLRYYRKAHLIIKAAAVADYRPLKAAKQKIKKSKDMLVLYLVKNPDILKELGEKKQPHQILVGFAAETQNLIQNARKKLREKNCDWMIANRVGKKGCGFESDQNQVTLLSKNGASISLKKNTKDRIAMQIINILIP